MEGICIKFPQKEHARSNVGDFLQLRKCFARLNDIPDGDLRSPQVHVSIVQVRYLPFFQSALYGGNCVLIVTETEIQFTQLDISLARLAVRSIGLEPRQVLAIGLGTFFEAIQHPHHALSLIGAESEALTVNVGLAATLDLI